MIRTLIAAALAFGLQTAALADARSPADEALSNAASAIGRQVPGLTFTAADGRPVNLADLRGRPLLVSLIYTGCADVCPALMESLGPAIEAAQEALGRDSFTTITIGFDTRNDTPARMASNARRHGPRLANWLFLSADQETLDRLTDAVGFTIFPAAGGFLHMAQVTVVDGDGRVYRQVYGGSFQPPAIVEPLKDLVFGRQRPLASLDGLIDRIRWFCTVYSPNTGRYYFNYSLFIGAAIGLTSLLLVLAWLTREFVRSWGRPRGEWR